MESPYDLSRALIMTLMSSALFSRRTHCLENGIYKNPPPSPLCHRGKLFLLNGAGMMTCTCPVNLGHSETPKISLNPGCCTWAQLLRRWLIYDRFFHAKSEGRMDHHEKNKNIPENETYHRGHPLACGRSWV